MKFLVNDNCIGCGLCSNTCPDVFQLKDGVAVADPNPVDPSLESSAREAQEGCPVNAIENA